MPRIAIFFLSLLIIGAASCKKKEQQAEDLSTRDKLLGTWKRVLRATDYNNNGIIDTSEITRAPATDTLLLTLVPDATYSRILTYKSEPYGEHGTWHLQRDDGEIVFQPTTSTSTVDTFSFDTLSQSYFRYRTAYPHGVRRWEAFARPD